MSDHLDFLDESLATLHTSFMNFEHPETETEENNHPWITRKNQSPIETAINTDFDKFMTSIKDPDEFIDLPEKPISNNCFMQYHSSKLPVLRPIMNGRQSTMSFRVQSTLSIQSDNHSDLNSKSLDLLVIPPIASKRIPSAPSPAPGKKMRMPKIADVQEDLTAIMQYKPELPQSQSFDSFTPPATPNSNSNSVRVSSSVSNQKSDTSFSSNQPILSTKSNTNIPVSKPRTYLIFSVLNTIVFFPFFAWIPGLTFSLRARNKFRTNDQVAGNSMAKYALITNVINLISSMALIILIALVVLLPRSKLVKGTEDLTTSNSNTSTNTNLNTTVVSYIDSDSNTTYAITTTSKGYSNPITTKSTKTTTTSSTTTTTTTEQTIFTINLNLLRSLVGHTAMINDLVVLKNGQLASASDDYTIRIWNSSSGVLLSNLTGHTSWVNALSCLSNGLLVSASWDNTMRVWNTTTSKQVLNITDTIDSLLGLGNNVLAVGSGFVIKLWNTTLNLTLIKTFVGHSHYILSLTVLEDGCLVSGSEDKTIKIWNTTNGTLIRSLLGHRKGINVVKALSDGSLVSGSDDSYIMIWNPNNGSLIANLTGHTGWISSLAELKNNYLASGASDDLIKVWNLETMQLVQTLTSHKADVLAIVTLSNGYLASASADKTIKIWGVIKV